MNSLAALSTFKFLTLFVFAVIVVVLLAVLIDDGSIPVSIDGDQIVHDIVTLSIGAGGGGGIVAAVARQQSKGRKRRRSDATTTRAKR